MRVSATDPLTRPVFGWLAIFVAGYAALHSLYFLIPDAVLRDVFHHHAIVQPAAQVIAWWWPEDGVVGRQGSLQSPLATLEIVRGCDGAGLLFLMCAAVLACPARPRQLLLGLAGAIVLAGSINQGRIVGLYFVAARHPQWFDPLHNYLLPLLTILLCFWAFLAWSGWAARAQPRASRAALHGGSGAAE